MLDLHWGTLSGLKAAERPKSLRNVPEVNDVLEESIARIASHTGLTLGVEHVDRVARHLAQDMMRTNSLLVDHRRIPIHGQVADWHSRPGNAPLHAFWTDVTSPHPNASPLPWPWIGQYSWEALCRDFDLADDGEAGLEAVPFRDLAIPPLREALFEACLPAVRSWFRSVEGEGGVLDFFGYVMAAWDRRCATRAKYLGLCGLGTHLHDQLQAFHKRLLRQRLMSGKTVCIEHLSLAATTRSAATGDAELLRRTIVEVAEANFAGIEKVRTYADQLLGILGGRRDVAVFAEVLRSLPDQGAAGGYGERQRFLESLRAALIRAGFWTSKAEAISAGSGC